MILLLLLALLNPQPAIDAHAQAHADYLAETGNFTHSNLTPLLEVCDWAGENLYQGLSDPEVRWQLYADSLTHAATMDHQRTHHAVGTARMSDGRWAVVDIFCIAAPAPTTTTTPPTTTTTTDPPPDNRAAPRAATPPPPPPETAPTVLDIDALNTLLSRTVCWR